MKYRMPVYYTDFSCIGAACEDTCCGGWQIQIDDKSFEKYRNVSGQFGNRLRREMDAKKRVFHLKGRNCAFLNEKGLCDIYSELGKDSLCETCRTYPRHMEDYGETREIMLSLTCPEAARIILGDESKSVWKVKKKTVKRSEKERRMDPNTELLSCIQKMRKDIVSIIKSKEMNLYDRFAMALSYAHDLQRHFDMIYDETSEAKNVDENVWRAQSVEEISQRYLQPQAALRFTKKLDPFRGRSCERCIRIASWMRVMETLEPVLEHWEMKQGIICTKLYHSLSTQAYEKLEQEFEHLTADCEKEWENLFLYFIHTYLAGACYDEDVYSKVKLAVFSVVVIRQWCLFCYEKTGVADRSTLVAAAYRYAREVENSDANLELLEQHFQEDMQFGLKQMLIVTAGTYA
ncbi:MAG: flagellin lysine-N-methylase [Brotaphodocola sp.]